MLEEVLSAGLDALGIPYTEETLRKFLIYYDLLEMRNRQMNLTAISGEDAAARLHMLDCAAVLTHCSFSGKRVLDVGSGAGFPGLVLKILCPDISLTLLDSTKKRVLFQQEVCDALSLPDVCCLHLRAEDAPHEMRESFDIVISRAVARLNLLSELCVPFVRTGGLFLSMKGPAAEEELSEAKHGLQLLGCDSPMLIHYSVPGLDADRALISAKKNHKSPAQYPRHFSVIKRQPL